MIVSDPVSGCLVGADWNSEAKFLVAGVKGIDSDVPVQMFRHSVGQVD
jgi:hypothetical protein